MSDLTEMMEADAAEEAEQKPAGSLEQAQKLGAEVNELDKRIAKGEELLRELKARKNQILSRELVDMMDNLKIEDFSVAGRTFEAKPYVHASIPEEHRDTAHDWLEENDAGDLIKYEVVATFPKDSTDEVKALEKFIRERYQMATVETKRGVPWARLTSWLKELVESTAEDKVMPPLDIMGATIGRVVKIKVKKS